MATKDKTGELTDGTVVQFPLRGEWYAVHSPGSHIPSHGTNQLAQRYAFDLQRLDAHRHLHDASSLRTWLVGVPMRECHGYGEPVHAALGGEVVRTSDGASQRQWLHPVREIFHVLVTALTFRPTDRNLVRVVGNHVVVRSGEIYAVYAHLAPGSVTVAEGQQVEQGEVLGQIGSTGNSTAPHLHFQLMDHLDARKAKAVPALFAAYEVQRDGGWQLVRNSVPRTTERIRWADHR
jgi:Peptidase family M23